LSTGSVLLVGGISLIVASLIAAPIQTSRPGKSR